MWLGEYIQERLQKDPDVKPSIWNQFNNAMNENEKKNISVEG